MRSLTILSCLLAGAAWAGVVAPAPTSFDGYKVFRVPVGARTQRVNSVVDEMGLRFWQPASRKGAFADVEVPPAKVDAFRQAMKGFDLIVMHEDLGRSMVSEGTFGVYADGSANETWFQSYHAYNDHLAWLRDLQAQHPNISDIVSSGRSFEGNDITGLHLHGSGGKGNKPAIVFHGTVHAREWIGSMVVEFIANSLARGYADDNDIRGFVDKYDFYLFPIVNPDGFKYTQTRNRLWRKNRQPMGNEGCIGLDINRNWPYKWDGPGSSANPCAEDYRGEGPGDGAETKSLAGFLQQVQSGQGMKLYIDFHSYSQLFMTPWGFTCDAVPTNNDEYQSLASGAAEAIRSIHGTQFQTGPICSTIYQTAGNSVDYLADVVKADYAFAVELRDRGQSGFVLPPEQIVPSGEEAFSGVKYLLQNMK
ncbi:carboxypeptidase [Ophiocordyceps camponoti-floridani]|uniref:Carboxypeptidase n=1 Tax=Ophiocordyceps camponoti-floridani TaxID=2030778 RepID=A0A8H4VHA0_9HYPO|nr:carboxypeptidase [Ophiocordyceps camponoti-floridani]